MINMDNMEAKKEFILNQCEAILQEGMDSVYKIQRALQIIEKMKLYQDSYSDIENYIENKWNLNSDMLHIISNK